MLDDLTHDDEPGSIGARLNVLEAKVLLTLAQHRRDEDTPRFSEFLELSALFRLGIRRAKIYIAAHPEDSERCVALAYEVVHQLAPASPAGQVH
jgi:hypothetical protein